MSTAEVQTIFHSSPMILVPSQSSYCVNFSDSSDTETSKENSNTNKGSKSKTNTKNEDDKNNKKENKSKEGDSDEANGRKKARLVAGEVIKNWQSSSRGNPGMKFIKP